MSYLNKILGGNIPLGVIESIGGYQNTYNLKQNYGHYQIMENMENIEESVLPTNFNNVFNSQYGSIVTKSLELNRDKVLTGLRTLLTNSLEIAVENNRNELSKLAGSEDSTQIKAIIYGLNKTFSEHFLTSIEKLPINYNLFDLHVKLVHLSGLSGASNKNIEDMGKKLALELELSNSFKVESFIDISQTLVVVLNSSIYECNTLRSECLFNDEFINKLSLVVLGVWEAILSDIMDNSKYEKIVSIYAFCVDFADALYESRKHKNKLYENQNKLYEHLLDVANTTKISDSTTMKDLKTIEKNIDQSKVIKGMTAMLSSAVTNAVSKNSADLLRSIAASNKIAVSGATGSSFTLSNIKQQNTIQQETNANFVQQVTNKVMNDIGNKLAENIDMASKQATSDTKKLTTDEKASTSLGGMLDSVANLAGKGIDALAKTLSVTAGNSTENSTSRDITQELKDTFNLNQSFKYEKSDDVKNQLQTILSTENLAKCAADTKAENSIDLGKISVTGPIVISEISQINVVNDVMNCAFNQTIMNEVATKIVNDYDKTIKQLLENVNTTLDEQTKTQVQGDIYAAGVAGAAVLQSAGEAVSTASKGMGEGVSTASKGMGEGLSTAAQGAGKGLKDAGEGAATAAKGIGEGIGSVMSGIMMPLLAAGGVLVLLIILYVLFKTVTAKAPEESAGGEEE